jgi:aspartyl-tRNA(Asn)/glutamyl-tRNA(Gln) amidotransferase subunit A
MARSAMDCALMLNVLAGHDARDPAAQRGTPPDFASALTGDLTGLRIGVERTIPASAPSCDEALTPSFEDAVRELEMAGATIVEIEVPGYRALADASLVIMTAEAFSYHRSAFAERWQDYGRYTRIFIARGALLSGADYVTAQRARRVACAGLRDVLAKVDVIVTPTTAAGAPRYGDIDMATLMSHIFTGAFNSAGLPVAAAPIGFTAAGLPLSMQVIGHPLDEATVLAVADALQRRTDHHLAEPEVASHA